MLHIQDCSTERLFSILRGRAPLDPISTAILRELERRSKAGIRERLARVEQDLADFKAKHAPRSNHDLFREERAEERELAAAPAPCTHSQILRESGKCAACGVHFVTPGLHLPFWIVPMPV